MTDLQFDAGPRRIAGSAVAIMVSCGSLIATLALQLSRSTTGRANLRRTRLSTPISLEPGVCRD